ncbi:MAG: serine hydrolase [Rhodothermales bacterium]
MQKILSVWVCAAFLLILSSDQLIAQHDHLTVQIDSLLESYQQRFGIPGLAVAITDKETILYANAFGVQDLNTGKPLSPAHIFHMASVSKPFSAIAIMQLVEQGLMDLDERLVTYLPYFKLDDPRYKEITIRQMLQHNAGMPDEDDYEWEKPQYDEGAAERYVRSLSKETLIASPGEKWEYSNIAFDVLGDVIAKVSGKPFEVYINEHILSPLEMDKSSFLIEEIETPLRTSPHVGFGHMTVSEVYPYNWRHAPSSTLNANVIEMAHWGIANLNKGIYKEARILSEESYDSLWDPSVHLWGDRYNGLSWFIDTYKGDKTVEHGGRDTGYTSYFTLLPELGYSLTIACNDYFGPVLDIRNGLIDLLKGRAPAISLTSMYDEFDKLYKTAGFEAARMHYKHIEKTNPDGYVFGWNELNAYGRFHMNTLEEYQLALDVFTFNADLYPEESGVYSSLGDLYTKLEQRDHALVNYRKALALEPDNEGIISKIAQLKEEK